MIYKSIEPAKREQDFVSVLFGKLLAQHRQRILDIFEIEELSFDRFRRNKPSSFNHITRTTLMREELEPVYEQNGQKEEGSKAPPLPSEESRGVFVAFAGPKANGCCNWCGGGVCNKLGS